jgi:hypothetical protein
MAKVHKALMEARIQLQGMKLNKSGHNKFAGYNYFELGDFLPQTIEIFSKCNLCGTISFGTELAVLTITHLEDDSQIIITSPMAEANLKGSHPIQNLGAVETYSRRYLWVAAMEIVEHDALDATTGRKGDGPIITPRGEVSVEDKRMNVIYDVAEAIKERMQADDLIGAYEEYTGITDTEEKIVLWGELDSKTRSALKKHGESLKGK